MGSNPLGTTTHRSVPSQGSELRMAGQVKLRGRHAAIRQPKTASGGRTRLASQCKSVKTFPQVPLKV